MPFSAQQLIVAANYATANYDKKEPIDQINGNRAALKWLLDHKKSASFTGGSYKEPLFVNNGSNAQNYFGPDQVTYNERDPVRWTDFPHYNMHSGFWFDEDRLLAAGIQMGDGSSVPTANEKEVLADLLRQSIRGDREGMLDALAFEMYRDGSQSTKACPGIETAIKWVGNTGTWGGIDAVANTYWRPNYKIGSLGTYVSEMEAKWRECQQYGGSAPDAIFCGLTWYNALLTEINTNMDRQVTGKGNERGGVSLDPGTNALYFHGVEVQWDPVLDRLDTLLSTTTRSKTCYFVNSNHLTLRTVKGQWMVPGKPEKLPDRYVWYFGRKAKYSLTSNKRNALAILQAS